MSANRPPPPPADRRASPRAPAANVGSATQPPASRPGARPAAAPANVAIAAGSPADAAAGPANNTPADPEAGSLPLQLLNTVGLLSLANLPDNSPGTLFCGDFAANTRAVIQILSIYSFTLGGPIALWLFILRIIFTTIISFSHSTVLLQARDGVPPIYSLLLGIIFLLYASSRATLLLVSQAARSPWDVSGTRIWFLSFLAPPQYNPSASLLLAVDFCFFFLSWLELRLPFQAIRKEYPQAGFPFGPDAGRPGASSQPDGRGSPAAQAPSASASTPSEPVGHVSIQIEASPSGDAPSNEDDPNNGAMFDPDGAIAFVQY
ncbi:hypothetical protein H696_02513 [Fonticula alba]|uniref:Uncharacterized protein n=1 Tax=Fonticula alba TaxID=691883 RepID=A0A058ZCB4_FONAL|nr:hypothetical protein H696_02513 [Fonticula alba]KCV71573.1 hypothetical protein H696_02513 [Fonticula alba]|eukprot:XP_009494696.1 hypothetical protein H696_02513 [Fonticula alba]